MTAQNLLTTNTSAGLFTTGATTVNIGSAATAVNIGFGTGTTTINHMLKINYTGSSDSSLQITGTNTKGGSGYHDFLRVTNGGGGTNPTKWFRINSTGGLEILNNGYTGTIATISDTGIIGLGQTTGATNNIPLNNSISFNNHSYINDDGNLHITAVDGTIWINSNAGSDVRINTQSPASGGLVVQGNITSNTSGAGHSFFYKTQTGFNVTTPSLSMDNLNVRLTNPSGTQLQLQLSAVSGTFNCYATVEENISGKTFTGSTNSAGLTCTAGSWTSPATFNNLAASGDLYVAHITDTTNSRIYRVTAIHCQSSTGGYLAIERML